MHFSMVALLTAFMCVGGTLSGCAAVTSETNQIASEGHCGAVSPEESYWSLERTEDIRLKAEEHLGQSFDGELRALSPDRTAAFYSRDQLQCWSQRGSAFAAYLIAVQISGILSIETLTPEAVEEHADALPWIRKAATAHACPSLSRDAAVFFGCGSGLAEAQYWLALCHRDGLGGCSRDQGKYLSLCRSAREQGSTLASMLCRNE